MKRSVRGVVVFGALMVGCGGSSELDAAVSSPDARSSEQAALVKGTVFSTVIPPLPALPELVDLDKGEPRRYFPEGVASAVTAIFRDPGDPTRFNAIGFDVKSGKACFYVSGTASTALPRLRYRLEREVAVLAQSVPGLVASEHMVGYTFVPLHPDPVPGIKDPAGAWHVVSAAYAASLPYVEVYGKE